jgi:hypothetical protein
MFQQVSSKTRILITDDCRTTALVMKVFLKVPDTKVNGFGGAIAKSGTK